MTAKTTKEHPAIGTHGDPMAPASHMSHRTTSLGILVPRMAREEDLPQLWEQLNRELEADPGQGGFANNWNVIEDHFQRGRLTLLFEGDDAVPVAFATVTGGEWLDMLWVRPDWRGSGIGRWFVETLVWAAAAHGAKGLFAYDVREETRGFWTALGFRELPTEMQKWRNETEHLVRTVDSRWSPRTGQATLRVRVVLSGDPWDIGHYEPYGPAIERTAVNGDEERGEDGVLTLTQSIVVPIPSWRRMRITVRVDGEDVVRDKDLVSFQEENTARPAPLRSNFFALSSLNLSAWGFISGEEGPGQ